MGGAVEHLPLGRAHRRHQPAPSHEESLNLVKLVGPAVAKRVLPVIAAVAIALLGLRILRVRRRRAGEV